MNIALDNADRLEQRTFAYGEEIFARIDRHGPMIFTPAWFDELFMNLTMSDETVKVQLFRFIDALPLLQSDESVARHLREYFEEARDRLPAWIARSLRLIPKRGVLAGLLAWAARSNAQRLASRFISGSTVQEALQAVLRLREQSLTFTLDLLGEATLTESEADAVQQQYLDLLAGLPDTLNAQPEIPLIDRDQHGPIPRVNLSVKLSALYSQFDPIDPDGTARAVLRRLRPILQLARQRGAFINFDMEQYAFKDTTLRIFRDVLMEPEFRDWPDVGIALQAYLVECYDDLTALLNWTQQRGTPVTIRLVKGAYWDYETIIAAQHGWPAPVFLEKWQSDANYERCTRFLIDHHDHLRPAFGSHNIRSLAFALAYADERGLPPGALEVQMLYGMADPIKSALRDMKQRVRIYTPYGKLLPGMAYLVRRLLENTSNQSFLRAGFTEQLPEEVLLMNPTRQQPRVPATGSGHATVNGPRPTPFRNEPLADFSRQANREAMAQAIASVRQQLGQSYPLVINHEAIETSERLQPRCPSHHSLTVGQVSRATPAHAEQAIAAARAAFPGWRDTPTAERAALLRRVAAQFRQRRWELAAWVCFESAKPWREADADIAEAIDFCEYYALEALRLDTPRRRDVPGEDNEYFYEPRGVAVVIAPWNFPLAILCGMTTAALVTGNTVIMKPAEQSSVIAAKFMEILHSAGVPPGVVNYLPGVGEEIGPTLVNHRDVDLIAFTGSLPVGLTINEQAARTPPEADHIKRVVAELGGKNAIIVDDDADLDEAVKGVADSAFGYSGQKCSACSRVIVLEPIYDAFLHRLIETTRALTIAPAEDPGCAIGPVIDEDARQRIRHYIAKGQEQARLAYAGEVGALEQEGSYVAPHIFAEVPPEAVIAQEEIFGPVLAVIKARDLDHALQIANGTRFALTGGLFSRSPQTIARVRRQFRVGNLYINRKCTGALVDRQPFGGFKLSGIGSKAGGPDYLLQFVVPRVVTENTMRHGFAPAADAPTD
jgi:RHH-type proline utilization regulon transcriptional repressor/proline dehydrogenase/delta 1-pyrroline-5-carboxylate dehydrogenase